MKLFRKGKKSKHQALPDDQQHQTAEVQTMQQSFQQQQQQPPPIQHQQQMQQQQHYQQQKQQQQVYTQPQVETRPPPQLNTQKQMKEKLRREQQEREREREQQQQQQEQQQHYHRQQQQQQQQQEYVQADTREITMDHAAPKQQHQHQHQHKQSIQNHHHQQQETMRQQQPEQHHQQVPSSTPGIGDSHQRSEMGQQSAPTEENRNEVTRELVKKFIADIWNRGDLDLIPEVCHRSLRFNGSVGMDRVGHDGFARMVQTIRDALSDYHCEIHSMVVEGNKAFVRMRFTGRHTGSLLGFEPTGRNVAWMGASEFTVKGDKILKVWELGDVKSLESQLVGGDEQHLGVEHD